MPNTLTSPLMGIVVPVNLADVSPGWGARIQAALFSTVDAHDHSSGKGTPVRTAGLNIDADLAFNTKNILGVRSTRLAANGAPLALGSDIGCIYKVNGELFYNDDLGRQIQITQTGAVKSAPQALSWKSVTGTYTILASDPYQLFYIQSQTSATSISLPSSAAVVAGRTYYFSDVGQNQATNKTTITPNGGDKINGVNASILLSSNGALSTATTDALGNWTITSSGLSSGGGGSGGATTTTATFTQPAVGANQSLNVASTTGMQSGGTVGLVGGGQYQIITVVSSSVVTIQNTSVANIAPGTVIASGIVVTIGGPPVLLSPTAPGRGQAYLIDQITGLYTPVGNQTVVNVWSYVPSGTVVTSSTDWAPIFQAAVNACVNDGRSFTVYIPRGQYGISTTVYIENAFVSIVGESTAPQNNGSSFIYVLPPYIGTFPAFQAGYRVVTGPTTITRGALTYAKVKDVATGGQLATDGLWYTDHDIGNVDQVGDFTRRFYFRFTAEPSATQVDPIEGCGGGRFSSGSGYTCTWELSLNNSAGAGTTFLYLRLICNDGEHTITSSHLSPNVDYHVAITRSTSSGKLTFWINGLEQTAARGGTQDLACTSPIRQPFDTQWRWGNLLQNWPVPAFPYSQISGIDLQLASEQFCIECLYTADFTPPTTNHAVTTSTTKWLTNFPAVAPLRPEIVTVISSVGNGRTSTGDTVLMRWHGTRGAGYTNNINFKYLGFGGMKTAIRFCTSINCVVEYCRFDTVETCVDMADFSYKNTVRYCQLNPSAQFNPRAWGVYMDQGSQYVAVENSQLSGGQYGIMGGNGGVYRSLWITNATGAAMYVYGVSCTLHDCYLIDDQGTFGEAAMVCSGNSSVEIQGGYLFCASSVKPNLILDGVNSVYVTGTLGTPNLGTQPCIRSMSQSSGKVVIRGQQGFLPWTDWIDVSAPTAFTCDTYQRGSNGAGTGNTGFQVTAGIFPAVLPVTADADILVSVNQMGAATADVLTITDTTPFLTVARRLVMPFCAPGMSLDIWNNTAKALTVTTNAPTWVAGRTYGGYALISDVAGTHALQRYEIRTGGMNAPGVSGAVEPTWSFTTPYVTTTDDGSTKGRTNAASIRWLYVGPTVAGTGSIKTWGTTVTIAAGMRASVSSTMTGWRRKSPDVAP